MLDTMYAANGIGLAAQQTASPSTRRPRCPRRQDRPPPHLGGEPASRRLHAAHPPESSIQPAAEPFPAPKAASASWIWRNRPPRSHRRHRHGSRRSTRRLRAVTPRHPSRGRPPQRHSLHRPHEPRPSRFAGRADISASKAPSNPRLSPARPAPPPPRRPRIGCPSFR
jgi:hypothetical protein